MDKVFNTIYFLITHFNNLLKAIEAEELMNQEIKTETYQRDRCIALRNECVKAYGILYTEFESDLTIVSQEVAIELSKRDPARQSDLHAQLFNILNEFRIRFNNINASQNFSEELIGTQFKTILKKMPDGSSQEEQIEYNFSFALLADDLSNKFNQLQETINKSFKFLNITSSIEINSVDKVRNKRSNLSYLLQLYYQKDCTVLTKNMVDVFANTNKLNGNELKKRLLELHKNNLTTEPKRYRAHDNANNAKAFKGAYESLLEFFKDNNDRALESVTNDYNQLKGTYPSYMI